MPSTKVLEASKLLSGLHFLQQGEAESDTSPGGLKADEQMEPLGKYNNRRGSPENVPALLDKHSART